MCFMVNFCVVVNGYRKRKRKNMGETPTLRLGKMPTLCKSASMEN